MGRRHARRQARAANTTNSRYAELAIALVAFLVPLFRKMLASRQQQQQQQQQQQSQVCAHHQELTESMRHDCEQCTEVREQQAKTRAEQQQQGSGLAEGFKMESMLKVIVTTYSLIAGYDRRSKRRSKKRSAMPLIMGGLMKAGYSMFTATMNGATRA